MPKLHIVMYHYVRDLSNSRYPNLKGLTVSQFREQIAFLKKNFHIIDYQELLDYKINRKAIPENSVLLTFDDGYIDHYTNVFPLLMQNNISGVFFVPGKILDQRKMLLVNKIHLLIETVPMQKLKNRFLDFFHLYASPLYPNDTAETLYQKHAVSLRYGDQDTLFVKQMLQFILPQHLRSSLTDQLFSEFIMLPEEMLANEFYINIDQIKTMKKCGMHFGLHGYEHHWLGYLSHDEMQRDIDQAMITMHNVLDEHWMMCYPYGNYNDDLIQYIQEKGCCCGVTTASAIADMKNPNWFCLPRLDTNDFPPKSDCFKKAELL